MASKSRDLIVRFVGEDKASRVVNEFGDTVDKTARKSESAGSRIRSGFGSKVDDMARQIPGAGTAIDGLGLDFDAMGSKSLIAGGLVAGAGVAAFTSVKMFSDLALEVGRFSDAAGISADAASRWIEVTGDLGLEAGVIEDSFKKMNVQAGKSPALFDKFGVSIALAKDGSVDANATFLNVIDRLRDIKDPTERAAAAQQLLGRSWDDLAEVINDPKLRANLEAVSGAKIIDEGEVEQARKLRDAMDKLKDAGEKLALTLGGAVIPGLTQLADAAGMVGDAVDLLPGDISLVTDALSWFSPMGQAGHVMDAIKGIGGAFRDDVTGVLGPAIEKFDAAGAAADNLARGGLYVTERDAKKAGAALAKMGDDTDDTTVSVKKLDDSLDFLNDALDIEAAALSAADAVARLGQEGENTAENVNGAKQSVLNLAESLDGFLSDQQRRTLAVQVQRGDLSNALRDLENIRLGIAAVNNTPVVVKYSRSGSTANLHPLADGGVATGPTAALVAEAGRSEAIIPLDPNGLPPAWNRASTPTPSGSGPTVNINVNAAVVDQRALGRAVEEARAVFARSGGRLVA